MGIFKLQTDYQPSGDQPEAIAELEAGIRSGKRFQVLLGVTGSGKTFTIANVIARLDRPDARRRARHQYVARRQVIKM